MTSSFDDYAGLAADVRRTMHRRLDMLNESWKMAVSDRDKFIYTWQVALLTAALDVSSSAVLLTEHNELRAARVLDRTLAEYAFRLHHYSQRPGRAEHDGQQYENFLRHILKANGQVQGDMTMPQFKKFRTFISTGSSELTYPQIHCMMQDTLKSIGLHRPGDIRRAMRNIEAEYAIASAIAHGSQGLLADIYRIIGKKITHERSPWFTRNNMMIRINTSLLLSLLAIERYYQIDAGCDMLMRSLALLVQRESRQSVQPFTENAMLSILHAALRNDPFGRA